jgi:pyrroloquinoline quinone biosynthesis protein E
MNDRPYGLLAELTYRCPLHCPYCSNPVKLAEFGDELTLDELTRVLAEARELGVLQLHLSGGEPLQRRDLLDIVAEAHHLGFYTNLITSALSLTPEKAAQLKKAGLDNVQISIQAADPELSDRIAGTPSYQRKVAAARAVKALGFPLTLNYVLHRHNIDQVGPLIELAEQLEADRVELANTQYYGWALQNRALLMPTRAQLGRIEPVVRAAIDRLAGRMQILYVFPDYYSPYPKPCMGGWGSRQLTLRPNGDVLPCQAADQIPGLTVENVRRRGLEWIWVESPMFNRFRGQDWMQEPCRSCPRKSIDFGGCRCQAFLLTGDPAATDPVCYLAPRHALVSDVIQAVNEGETDVTQESLPEFAYRWLEGVPVASASQS